MKAIAMFSALALTSNCVLGHDGHGHGSASVHDMHHMLITLGIVGLVVSGAVLWRRFYGKN